tara:strand:+ start:499 stop:705 length:207 start_codon:yes stop_codon:yes gene_type:complete
MPKTYYKNPRQNKPNPVAKELKHSGMFRAQTISDKREKEQQRRHEKGELNLKRWRAELEKSEGDKDES